jgi:hypothetical protein
VYSWGVIRKVNFPGINMDIGHIRPIGYSKDNDKTTWIAYNKLRGQYMSALEHQIPEQFYNNPNKCNLAGSTPNPLLPACGQGISAVKAIALAANQGQKIYTITRTVYANNPNIVSGNLFSHSANTRQAVQNALDIGHEVTIHEKPITQSGWTGAGYTTIDPETGAGGYIIDGGSNGGWLQIALFYIATYGAGAWEKIRADRTLLQSQAGGLVENYRDAEHFVYAFQQINSGGDSWLKIVILTEGYSLIKAIVNVFLQGYSPWAGSPATFQELNAGLLGAYCAAFGCTVMGN